MNDVIHRNDGAKNSHITPGYLLKKGYERNDKVGKCNVCHQPVFRWYNEGGSDDSSLASIEYHHENDDVERQCVALLKIVYEVPT